MREDCQMCTHWPHMINKKEKMKVRSRKTKFIYQYAKRGAPYILKDWPSCKIRGAGFLGSVIGKIGFKHMAKLALQLKHFYPKLANMLKKG